VSGIRRKPALPAQMRAKGARRKRPTAKMTASEVRHFLEALARDRPDPRSELDFVDPYTLLISVVLSAQTTDAAVNRATEGLFREAPTPVAMVALGVDGVAKHIHSLGFWQTKSRNVVELSRQLVERFGGNVPRERAALESLPGVGRKSANVVLNVAFGEGTLAVDTHVFRVANRTGIAPGKTPLAVEESLMARVPPELLHNAHHWLILHGRYVCKARQPECWRCVAAQWCRYRDKTPVPETRRSSK
jgi:endonuclease III